MIQIDQALVSEFIAGNFGLPIAHENEAFNPAGAFAELLVLQNNRTPLSLNNTDETDGVFRVLLSYPANQGAIGIKAKAQEILNHFHIGKRCHFGGVGVRIESQQRQPGLAEKGWYRIVLTLGYRSFLPRPN